jgi:hypothetical protein
VTRCSHGIDERPISQRHCDIVEAFQQGGTLARVDLEDDLRAVRTCDRPGIKVDFERGLTVDGQNLLFKGLTIGGRKHDRQHAVLDQALAIHLGKTAGDDATHAMGGKRPNGSLARAAATEIGSSDKDRRAMKARPVEHEGLVGINAPARKQRRLIVRLQGTQELHRCDLIGVDVVDQKRRSSAANKCELFHHALPMFRISGRGSQTSPMTAAAAAAAGLARCVRTPVPCRPSKFRLVVETMRSPAMTFSPPPPAHMEQPGSPQRKPASVSISRRPCSSACRETACEPGTTTAFTCAATLRPTATCAALLMSSSLALVQEPMKTRSILVPARRAPGGRAI